MELAEIYAPVQEDLTRVEDRLVAVSQADYPRLSELLDYSLKSNGKRIRPILTLMSGQFYDYNLELLLPMATAVEIMHTATLVHDDAIDNSQTRRGRRTVYSLWGAEKAVLLGDYLFAEAGALTASTGNLRVIKLFARTLKTISSGELSQSFSAFDLEQSRSQYMQRVTQKTASLFCMSTESGAALSQAPEASIQILIEYAHNLGIAFQIVDDILDFIGTEEELGKPTGSDLAQGTITLPSILLLERYPEDNPVKRLFRDHDDRENIKQAIEMVRDSSIIQECYQVASEYSAQACRNLKQLPDNASRQSLLALADYIVRRKR
ncbi:MAG: polyprenyl synthetase family protein [Dehalococcoidales bacterium]|nr:polyprenyl synthetase family protein [Dehalococcoidales bacterium]MDZ4230454.1 polyprenyl synthetase family protein [Dehalococcoidales bacterium]